jgi:hypothetical protein
MTHTDAWETSQPTAEINGEVVRIDPERSKP